MGAQLTLGDKPESPKQTPNQKKIMEELYKESIDLTIKQEHLNFVLSQQPPANWVKDHPFITGYKYLPIDKVEYLLQKLFKRYKIEIMRENTAFNGVYVVVRVHYLNPTNNEMDFHDGIGACELQTKKGTSPTDLVNINKGAISMAFPIAKTVAIKDACDHFGSLFGANLNRKDVISYTIDDNLRGDYKI